MLRKGGFEFPKSGGADSNNETRNHIAKSTAMTDLGIHLQMAKKEQLGSPEFDTNRCKSLIRIGQAFGIATTAASAGGRWWVS
jgi:hypothetical protein